MSKNYYEAGLVAGVFKAVALLWVGGGIYTATQSSNGPFKRAL